MFGLGVPELIFILLLALLIFGPKKLPQIGRTLGRGMAQVRKASTELQRTLNTEGLADEIRQSDPRRILREELHPRRILSDEPAAKRPPAASEAATPEPGTAETATPETADETPHGNVARSGAAPAKK